MVEKAAQCPRNKVAGIQAQQSLREGMASHDTGSAFHGHGAGSVLVA